MLDGMSEADREKETEWVAATARLAKRGTVSTVRCSLSPRRGEALLPDCQHPL